VGSLEGDTHAGFKARQADEVDKAADVFLSTRRLRVLQGKCGAGL
jgi:hypothetical protein